MPFNDNIWRTTDELRFIRGLGTWAPESYGCKAAGKRVLLQRYKITCLKRHDWGDIDRGRVMAMIDRELMTAK